MLKDFTDWLQTHSILLTEGIRQILIVGMTFELLRWTPEQLGVVLSAVSAVLAIFAAKHNVSASNVDRIVERRMSDQAMDPPTPRG